MSTFSMPAKYKFAALLAIVLLGFVLRLRGLDSVGFNEDEINKVEAARGYLHGDFSLNLEHPMFMKSLVAVSMAVSDAWNRHFMLSHQISEEVAVRLPNVLVGSLTAVILFFVAEEFFGVEVALFTALLWSVSTIAIAVNRIAKEDTLLVFFTWLAYYFYLRAKALGPVATGQRSRFYTASGASFGLMLASKYFPHYLGLNALYYQLSGADKNNRLPRRDLVLCLGACTMVFLIANPVVLLPSTLRYMVHYAREGTVTHHGYLMMGQLLYNDPAHLRGGMPIFFYPLFLLVKTPLPVLAAFIVGLVDVIRRRREPGPHFVLLMFMLWIIPFSLLSAKWLRWMLAWMPTVTIISAIGIARILSWCSKLVRQHVSLRFVPAVVTAIVAIFLVEPAWVAAKSGPVYSLYLNPVGMGRTGYYFPHDEVNDAGLREAIQEVCEEAPLGASVGGEGGAVFAYYFHKLGRDDLHYFDLSDQVRRMEASPSRYLVIQDARKYFDNAAFIQGVESFQTPIRSITIGGTVVARIYRDEGFARPGELQ